MDVLNAKDGASVLARAAEELLAGNAILYPTDTVYALGVDALSLEAVEAAFRTKGRARNNPLSLCVANIEQAREYVHLDARAEILAQKFLPGALTLVCASAGRLSAQMNAGLSGIGIRIPGHPFGPALAGWIGRPITATSANQSGLPPATNRLAAENAFADAYPKPTLLVDDGESLLGMPSTVIDLTSRKLNLVREGAIKFQDILAALGAG